MTVSCPREVAYEMLPTVSPGPASPSCAAVVRCQVTPLREVQITACVALSPTAPAPAASHPPGPPASRVAAYPSGACPPPGARTGARCQDSPPSIDTKNCWRTVSSLVSQPVATIVRLAATMRLIAWNTPRFCCPG